MIETALTTRFAPSPTGELHLGHAFAALVARDAARASGGRYLVRIEDIDRARCREEFVTRILDDLEWLGLSPDAPATRQEDYLAAHGDALRRLDAMGLVYPCFCTRAEIRAAASAPQEDGAGVAGGPDGPIYPGTCRRLGADERRDRIASGQAYALRLDMARAIAQAATRAGPLFWRDRNHGTFPAQPEIFGDVVLARKEIATGYHLAVTLDDARQGITLVTRGADLMPSTHVHRLLQALLDLPVPLYAHHPLLAGPDGKRLAKRHDALSLRHLREAGYSPAEVAAMAAAAPRLPEPAAPAGSGIWSG
ncbi:MAG: tRNA glutamyl-Q(34) synthetase GluQRS [Alphaproteobacteria bacterium]